MTRWLLVCWAIVHIASTAVQAAEPSGPATSTPANPASANSTSAKPAAAPAIAPEPAPDERTNAKSPSLPIPRFVSLRAESVNLRVGPNARYPVEWIYVRRQLPVEVVAEFDTWRRIRDPDGTEGWVHSSMLSGRRTGIVKGEIQPLRRSASQPADVVANLEPGVIVEIRRCAPGLDYCRVEVAGVQGWIKRESLWGLYPDEAVE